MLVCASSGRDIQTRSTLATRRLALLAAGGWEMWGAHSAVKSLFLAETHAATSSAKTLEEPPPSSCPSSCQPLSDLAPPDAPQPITRCPQCELSAPGVAGSVLPPLMWLSLFIGLWLLLSCVLQGPSQGQSLVKKPPLGSAPSALPSPSFSTAYF